jgi:ABC-type Fe3+ transport system permease subunit
MPESRSRSKKARSQRYQLEPQRKQHSKGSPRWYGPMLLVVMGLGVLIIVLNYVGIVLPGAPSNGWLWGGLGVIGLGFFGTMYWR